MPPHLPPPTPWAHAGTVAQWHSNQSRCRFTLAMPEQSDRERLSCEFPTWHVLVRRPACWKGEASETDTASCADDAQYSLGRLCTGNLAGGYLVPVARNVRDMLPDQDQLTRIEEAHTTDAGSSLVVVP
jgi:hypothetical protein